MRIDGIYVDVSASVEMLKHFLLHVLKKVISSN